MCQNSCRREILNAIRQELFKYQRPKTVNLSFYPFVLYIDVLGRLSCCSCFKAGPLICNKHQLSTLVSEVFAEERAFSGKNEALKGTFH